jgi:hypothetical protein
MKTAVSVYTAAGQLFAEVAWDDTTALGSDPFLPSLQVLFPNPAFVTAPLILRCAFPIRPEASHVLQWDSKGQLLAVSCQGQGHALLYTVPTRSAARLETGLKVAAISVSPAHAINIHLAICR